MIKLLVRGGFFSVLISLIASSAFAERMSGQDVAALFSRGTLEFQAGSIWTTLPDNHYSFVHGRSKEEGTFKILGKGNVHIIDEKSGRTIKFYFDRNSNDVVSLIYLTGKSKGRSYPIK